MLIALATVLFLSGGGGLDVFTKQDRKLVQEIVVDETRASAVVDEMKSAQKSLDGTVKEIGGLIKEWRKIDTDFDSGRAELEPLMRQTDALRSDALDGFADSIFEMRQQMTAEEWEALHPGTQHDDDPGDKKGNPPER